MDGTKYIHDKRRPYRSGLSSSFGDIIHGLERIIGKFLIRLRLNVDNDNLNDVWKLLELFKNKGWLTEDKKFYPYLAQIMPYTDICTSVERNVCISEEFHNISLLWLEQLHKSGVSVKYKKMYEFPEPRYRNCSAACKKGFTFTPSGEIHKCGLTINEPSKAVGILNDINTVTNSNLEKWESFSPFEIHECRICKMLPTCLAGCPRNHIEHRQFLKSKNCEFYKNYEIKFLKKHLELS